MKLYISFGNVLLCIFLMIHESQCGDLTVQVKSGAVDCFYEDFKKDTEVELDYQVIDGGDLDIKVTFYSPNGDELFSKASKSEGSQTLKTVMGGVHAFCLDNAESSYFDKLVYFDLEGTKSTDEEDEFNNFKFQPEESSVDADLGTNLKKQLGNLKNHLDNAVHIQNLLRTFEARDRAQSENNFTRVNIFSCIQLFVMMSVGLVQVIMIRGLFSSPGAKATKMRT